MGEIINRRIQAITPGGIQVPETDGDGVGKLIPVFHTVCLTGTGNLPVYISHLSGIPLLSCPDYRLLCHYTGRKNQQPGEKQVCNFIRQLFVLIVSAN